MAITKTNFINYTRCPRYVALDELKKEKLDSEVTYEEYLNEENQEKLIEILGDMYESTEEGEEDLIDVKNTALESMMYYYKKIEILTGEYIAKNFKGKTTYAEDTKSQESFDFNKNGIRYMCYVDVLNENDEGINIIEVKATTSRQFISLAGGYPKQEKFSIFYKKNNIYYLKDELNWDIESEMAIKTYSEKREKLFNRYGIGKYVHDLAVQRYFIEGEYKETHQEDKINKTKYYLGVLNHEYIKSDNEDHYPTDDNGQEVITLFDMTNITKEYLKIIDNERINLESYLKKMDISPCKLGDFCQFKKTCQCKFFNRVCGKMIPKYNSSISYMNLRWFTVDGIKYNKLDLVNEGYYNLLDVPEHFITSPNHVIQRDCYRENKEYIDKEKIQVALKELEYPIYHLDFETFPCPLPRYKGEYCYTQSPFEFSLHIEHEPGKCDFDKDNYVFLAKSHQDEREDMVKMLCKLIDPNKGTLFAQNVTFEKARIKELAEIFPEYKEHLLKIRARAFDLLYIVRNNEKMYLELGYEKERASLVNYYHPKLSGSYSIKKTLPVFTDLKYDNLEVKNGTEAYITYLNYPLMNKEEFNFKYGALVTYCKQDTWAMVLILEQLRQLVNK